MTKRLRRSNDSTASLMEHHAHHVLAGCIGTVVVLAVIPLPQGVWICTLLSIIAIVVICWMLGRDHDRKLCEHCIAAMPLDPARAAQRHRRKLMLIHTFEDRRKLAAFFAALLGANVALVAIPVWPVVALWCAAQAALLYIVLAWMRHRAYQPWCPICSDDGGGEEIVDSPVPLNPVGTGI